MFTKRFLHNASSLQTSANAIDNNPRQQSCEYFLSFDTIFVYGNRGFNINNCIQKWIPRKRTLGEHGMYVLQNAVA